MVMDVGRGEISLDPVRDRKTQRSDRPHDYKMFRTPIESLIVLGLALH